MRNSCHKQAGADRNSDTRYSMGAYVVASDHGDGITLLNSNKGKFFLANRIGAEIWGLARQGTACGDICERISAMHGIPRKRAEHEVVDFLDALQREGLLRIREPRRTSRLPKSTLVVRALWHLACCELKLSFFGLEFIRRELNSIQVPTDERPAQIKVTIWAMERAISFYPRRTKCLLRSIALTRMLRLIGCDAKTVIGYRTNPFWGHAWTEVGGRAIADSSEYRRSLHILDCI